MTDKRALPRKGFTDVMSGLWKSTGLSVILVIFIILRVEERLLAVVAFKTVSAVDDDGAEVVSSDL